MIKESTTQEVVEAIRKAPEDSMIYVGCDSITKHGRTNFITAVLLHYSGSKGVGVFIEVTSEGKYTRSRTKEKLLKEASYAITKALEIIAEIPEVATRIEVHLDLNPNPKHESNKAVKEALAYAKGQQLVARIKPDAIAAYSASDYYARQFIKSEKENRLSLN